MTGYLPEGCGDADVPGIVSRHMGAVAVDGFESVYAVGCATSPYHTGEGGALPGDIFVTAEQLFAERAARETQE